MNIIKILESHNSNFYQFDAKSVNNKMLEIQRFIRELRTEVHLTTHEHIKVELEQLSKKVQKFASHTYLAKLLADEIDSVKKTIDSKSLFNLSMKRLPPSDYVRLSNILLPKAIENHPRLYWINKFYQFLNKGLGLSKDKRYLENFLFKNIASIQIVDHKKALELALPFIGKSNEYDWSDFVLQVALKEPLQAIAIADECFTEELRSDIYFNAILTLAKKNLKQACEFVESINVPLLKSKSQAALAIMVYKDNPIAGLNILNEALIHLSDNQKADLTYLLNSCYDLALVAASSISETYDREWSIAQAAVNMVKDNPHQLDRPLQLINQNIPALIDVIKILVVFDRSMAEKLLQQVSLMKVSKESIAHLLAIFDFDQALKIASNDENCLQWIFVFLLSHDLEKAKKIYYEKLKGKFGLGVDICRGYLSKDISVAIEIYNELSHCHQSEVCLELTEALTNKSFQEAKSFVDKMSDKEMRAAAHVVMGMTMDDKDFDAAKKLVEKGLELTTSSYLPKILKMLQERICPDVNKG